MKKRTLFSLNMLALMLAGCNLPGGDLPFNPPVIPSSESSLTSTPTSDATSEPTTNPTSQPTSAPTSNPTSQPTLEPTSEPTSVPTTIPTSSPTSDFSSNPTSEPTSDDTSVPTSDTSLEPTSEVTSNPTSDVTSEPTSEPSSEPTSIPTSEPTSEPTSIPTSVPTSEPTSAPTSNPTSEPSSHPTSIPTDVTSGSIPSEVEQYYESIKDDMDADELLDALQALNKKMRTSTVGYSAMGTTPSGQFKYTDYDPETVQYDSNGQPYGTRLISFYSGNSATGGMNREHVWPKSHGGNTVESDIHMPRPTIIKENGSRGNSFYVEGMKDEALGWDPAMESFGLESYRGDSARIIFYCIVANPDLSLVDIEYHASTNDNRDYLMGKLSDMLKWNLENPVLQREQNRNSGAQYLQGNRNPFIDHPEYACRIWGGYNENTRKVCGLN